MKGLTLSVRNYRAIESADIELADLTVLAGVNSSGKSTLARLFHRLICIKADFATYAANHAFELFRHCVLMPLKKSFPVPDERYRRTVVDHLFLMRHPRGDFKAFMNRLVEGCEKYFLRDDVCAILEDGRFQETFRRYLPSCVDAGQIGSTVKDIIAWVARESERACGIYLKLVKEGESNARLFFSADFGEGPLLLQDSSLCDDMPLLASAISTRPEPIIKIFDDRGAWVDSQDKALSFPKVLSPRQSFYIAQPAVDFPSVRAKKLILNGVLYPLRSRHMSSGGEHKFNLGIEDLIGGAIAAPEEKPYVSEADWMFASKDGMSVYGLRQCADGIKSLATMSILDRYGLLEDDALLIIDEPEVHLHPQWVVGMARALVRLAKYRKVRVFVTTHSPDLVHAIRDFSENDGFGAKTAFYLAEKKTPEAAGYSYRSLGMNIGPIFSVFNKAKDDIATVSRAIREGCLG